MYGAQPTAIRSRWRRSCHQSHSRCLLLQTLAVQRRTQAGGRDHPRAFSIVTLRRQAPGSHFGQADDPEDMGASRAGYCSRSLVATDDERIADCCRGFGATVVMTSQSCENGTVRCSEALGKLKTKYNIVVNIQGDEPLIDPAIIDGVVLALQRAPDAVYSTAVTALKPEDALDTNRVKCVTDQNGYAIYFSRGLVPHNKKGTVNTRFPYLLHLGIQCYDAKFLAVYANMKPTPLQLQEDLEQLKVLENGYKMKVIKVDHDAHGVDTPEDLAKVEALMQSHHIL